MSDNATAFTHLNLSRTFSSFLYCTLSNIVANSLLFLHVYFHKMTKGQVHAFVHKENENFTGIQTLNLSCLI